MDLKRINPRLVLKVTKRARRMALRLDVKQRVMNLVIPPRASLDKAYQFAKDNKDWISEKLDNLADTIHLEHGTILPVLGRNRRIKICYDETLTRTSITMTKKEIIVITNKEDPSSRILRFLKEKARIYITSLARKKAQRINKKIRSHSIRDTRSRWGSCAWDGDLSFSWRLILAPPSAFDYVIAHEIAHLSHMNHGKRFWDLCAELSCSYKAGRSWMDEHGHDLMRYQA